MGLKSVGLNLTDVKRPIGAWLEQIIRWVSKRRVPFPLSETNDTQIERGYKELPILLGDIVARVSMMSLYLMVTGGGVGRPPHTI